MIANSANLEFRGGAIGRFRQTPLVVDFSMGANPYTLTWGSRREIVVTGSDVIPEAVRVDLPDKAATDAVVGASFLIHSEASGKNYIELFDVSSGIRVGYLSAGGTARITLAQGPEWIFEPGLLLDYGEAGGPWAIPLMPNLFTGPEPINGLRVSPPGGGAFGANAYAIAYNFYGEVLSDVVISREADGSLFAFKSTTNIQPDSYYHGYIVVMGYRD